MRQFLMAFCATVFLVAAHGPGSAQNSSGMTQANEAVSNVLSGIEQSLIRKYFRNQANLEQDDGDDAPGRGKGKRKGKGKAKGKNKSKKTPPGLAKREGGLPPGLAKRDTLPPGLQGRGLPNDLQGQLPNRGLAQEIQLVGNDAVLVEKATGVILDILRNVTGPN